MNTPLILEWRFTMHQRIQLTVVIGGAISLKAVSLLVDNNAPKFTVLAVLLFLVVGALICLACTKRGVFKSDNNLYRGLYFRSHCLLKKKISLTDKTKVTVLELNKRQKSAWFSDAKPDHSISYARYDVTLLNDKHTEKELLVSLDTKELAQKTTVFLEQQFGLVEEVYSPDFR